jgi:hypothetical protein
MIVVLYFHQLCFSSVKGSDIPIFIWYDDYPTHCSPDFKDKSTNACRVARVEPGIPYIHPTISTYFFSLGIGR